MDLLNRLTELCEIPFSHHLNSVHEWTQKLVELTFCDDGFSINGESDGILACYNDMITSVLIRMQHEDTETIANEIDWILKYQNFERNVECKWKSPEILKYGGCMKSTPCFIGVVKSTIALSEFKRRQTYQRDPILEKKLKSGLEYIFSHELFKRKSDGIPITNDILKINYPFSYKTNIIEILRLVKANALFNDKRCNATKAYLKSKRRKDGYWVKAHTGDGRVVQQMGHGLAEFLCPVGVVFVQPLECWSMAPSSWSSWPIGRWRKVWHVARLSPLLPNAWLGPSSPQRTVGQVAQCVILARVDSAACDRLRWWIRAQASGCPGNTTG